MTVNLGNNTTNTSGTDPEPLYEQSAAFQALPTAQQDELIASESTAQLNAFFGIGAPSLPFIDPMFKSNDSALFYTKTADATHKFGENLNAQSTKDQQMRGMAGLAAVQEAQILAQEIAAYNIAYANAQSASLAQATSLSTSMTGAQTATANQQTNISTFNSGNSQDRTQYSNLSSAYSTFVSTLNSLGATVSNGSYTIPSGSANLAAYNSAVATYQSAVNSYNSYMANRASQATSYNSSTAAYNSAATSTNSTIDNIVTTNKLGPYLASNNLNLDQSQASNANSSIYASLDTTTPHTTQTDNATVPIPSLPSYVASGATNGPTPIGQISYGITDANQPTTATLQTQIINSNYNSQLSSMQQSISTASTYFAFLQLQASLPQLINVIPNPLLNTKRLTHKILPDTITNAAKPTKVTPAGGANALTTAAIGVSNSNILSLLAGDNLKQVIRNLTLQTLDPKNKSALETQLLTLQVGRVATTSQNSLLPALNSIKSALSSLSATSPAIAALFALSFANRVTEEVGSDGATAVAVTAFINANPALKGLTPDQASQITAALNLGQTLVALKLLETNLGITDLSNQILTSLVSPGTSKTILQKVALLNQQTQVSLRDSLITNFKNQGFKTPEATFLAQTGVSLSTQTLTPSPSSLSPSDLGKSTILQDSIAASLILSSRGSIDVTNAQQEATTALDAISENNTNQSNISDSTFRAQLESQFRQQGLSATVAVNAAQEAVLPALTTTLSTSSSPSVSPSSPTPSLSSSTSANTPNPTPSPSAVPRSLNQAQLQSFVQNQLTQLLLPELGIDLTNQVIESTAISLFGTPHPDSSDIAAVKSPNSIINAVHQQIKILTKDRNQMVDQALSDSFSSTIQNSTDLYTFLTRAMDPAFLYTYSANAGIMYSRPINQSGVSQSFRNSLDINV